MAEEAAKKKRKRDVEKKEKMETEWPEIEIKAFLESLSLGRNTDIEFQGTIDTKELMAVELPSKERGNIIAKLVDDAMDVHWT
ncbi:MAG TPA: hypothetical protein VGO47_05900 [Chlamydiales bacterium]|jgi:hypothetical protein|nr:hypothetical protein [Chlamydiales bacterium]